MSFDIIASTGRTATTYIAAILDQISGVTATHEGYQGSDKTLEPLLPLVNLENQRAFTSVTAATEIARDLRGPEAIETALHNSGETRLIDVAYYNAMIGPALLAEMPQTRMLGLIRDCESFVRSATAIAGEDPLPVGWPSPDKPLTGREKFIAMGRIRPGRGSPEKAEWSEWSAIRRNIWLWRETNARLCEARQIFGSRVALVPFAKLEEDAEAFWACIASFFDVALSSEDLPEVNRATINRKPSGYQVGPASDWTDSERAALMAAQQQIEESVHYVL